LEDWLTAERELAQGGESNGATASSETTNGETRAEEPANAGLPPAGRVAKRANRRATAEVM
jgi:hypothetical protein